MERKDGAFLLHTDNADIKVCFVTDEIVRVRASFDHELAEESYILQGRGLQPEQQALCLYMEHDALQRSQRLFPRHE